MTASTPAGRDAASDLRAWWWGLTLPVVLTIAVYAPRLGDYFVSDDFDLLHWAVVTPLLEGIVRPPWQTWLRPATDLLWQATAAAFGERATWHHVVNLWLHLANAALVGALTWRASASRVAAVAAAALFSLHPTAVAAVQWLSGRYDLLSTCLALVALLLACAAVDRARPVYGGLSVACGLLALLAKEAAVAVPFVLVAFAWPRLAPAARGSRPLAPWSVAAAMLALLPVYFGVRWLLFGGLGGYGWHGRLAWLQVLNPLFSLPLATFPWHLDSPLEGLSRFPWLIVAVGSAVVLAWRAPLFACAYLAAFVPILNMVGTGGFITAEVARLMYFPMAMVAVGMGIAVDDAMARAPRAAGLACAVALVVALTGTWTRLSAWKEAASITAAFQQTLVQARGRVVVPVLFDCRRLPDNVRGAWVYRTGFDTQPQLVFGDRTGRGMRAGSGAWSNRDEFTSRWCVSPDGTSLTPGLCE